MPLAGLRSLSEERSSLNGIMRRLSRENEWLLGPWEKNSVYLYIMPEGECLGLEII